MKNKKKQLHLLHKANKNFKADNKIKNNKKNNNNKQNNEFQNKLNNSNGLKSVKQPKKIKKKQKIGSTRKVEDNKINKPIENVYLRVYKPSKRRDSSNNVASLNNNQITDDILITKVNKNVKKVALSNNNKNIIDNNESNQMNKTIKTYTIEEHIPNLNHDVDLMDLENVAPNINVINKNSMKNNCNLKTFEFSYPSSKIISDVEKENDNKDSCGFMYNFRNFESLPKSQATLGGHAKNDALLKNEVKPDKVDKLKKDERLLIIPGEFNAREKMDQIRKKVELVQSVKEQEQLRKQNNAISLVHNLGKIIDIKTLLNKTKTQITNSDMLLTMFEVMLNPLDYLKQDVKNVKILSGKSEAFWKEITKTGCCPSVFNRLKPETFKKYWIKISEKEDYKQFIEIVNKNREMINSPNLE